MQNSALAVRLFQNKRVTMQERNIRIKLGETKTCLADTTVAALAEPRSKTKTITKILRTPYGDFQKQFVRVEVGDDMRLADFIAGTLYDAETGQCLATPHLSLVM